MELRITKVKNCKEITDRWKEAQYVVEPGLAVGDLCANERASVGDGFILELFYLLNLISTDALYCP